MEVKALEAEREMFRDIWIFFRMHHDPPAVGTDACVRCWDAAAKDMAALVGGKWKNHPLAMALGIALCGYLEQQCKSKGGCPA